MWALAPTCRTSRKGRAFLREPCFILFGAIRIAPANVLPLAKRLRRAQDPPRLRWVRGRASSVSGGRPRRLFLGLGLVVQQDVRFVLRLLVSGGGRGLDVDFQPVSLAASRAFWPAPQKVGLFAGTAVSIPFGATELPQTRFCPRQNACAGSAVPPAAGPREGQPHSGGRPRRAYSSVSASSSSRTSFSSSSGSSSAGADAGLISISSPSAWPPAGRSGPPCRWPGELVVGHHHTAGLALFPDSHTAQHRRGQGRGNMYSAGSSYHLMISTFSPLSSSTMLLTRWPRGPRRRRWGPRRIEAPDGQLGAAARLTGDGLRPPRCRRRSRAPPARTGA